MMVRDLELLYDYGYWANRHLFQVMEAFSSEEFTLDVAGSYGSLRNTLVHMLSAEWGWLDRCGGHPRGPKLVAEDFPDLESLVSAWRQVEGYVRDFLSRLTEDDLSRVIAFRLGEGRERAMPLGELLHHGAAHGVHHRGQVALLLRMLGHPPGNFDMLFYYAGRDGVQQ